MKKNLLDIQKLLYNYLPFIGLIVVVVFFQIVSGGRLLSVKNMGSMVNEVFIVMLGTTGMVFLLSQGILDFPLLPMLPSHVRLLPRPLQFILYWHCRLG